VKIREMIARSGSRGLGKEIDASQTTPARPNRAVDNAKPGSVEKFYLDEDHCRVVGFIPPSGSSNSGLSPGRKH